LPIPIDDVRAAQRILARHFAATRLVRSATLTAGRRRVFLKLETELPTASFKVRGAVYSLTVNAARRRISEVVAASTGNHGAAVAHAGRLLDIPATIFLPERPNPVKARRIRDLGARVVEIGRDLSAAIDAAREHAERSQAFFLHDASDADIPAGTGTIAAEIISQLPEVDRIYVPMGDTALIRGVASAARILRPSVQIVGVVADRAPAYALSWAAQRPVPTDTADTIADGLAVTRPLAPNVSDICALVDRVVSVSEDEMVDAMRLLLTEEIVAEPAGAAATAGFRQESPADMTTALLVTGANVAPEIAALLQSGVRPADKKKSEV
jgi:threonine dehydratase